jgi:large subunit ribosomal protein L29
MAHPETADLRTQSEEDLRQELEEAHQALFNLRFQTATGQVADVSQVSKAKRRIARIKTLLREHELAVEQSEQEG